MLPQNNPDFCEMNGDTIVRDNDRRDSIVNFLFNRTLLEVKTN